MSTNISLTKKTCTLAKITYRHYGLELIPKRWYSDVILEPLKTRSILRVQGKEAVPFLQGLITNDMDNFGRGSSSIYTMFLNTSGRVMYDSLIHQIQNKRDDFIVECDASVVDQLKKHLNLFRIRKKVEISKPDWNIWVAFTALADKHPSIAPINSDHSGILIFKDARLQNLGFRIILCNSSAIDHLKNMFPLKINHINKVTYEQHRYILGIGEGIKNLPQGKCFPMESNCDYLRGVSFNKGCYIGQELTARTHHTGVVRKRLMPLSFYQHIAAHELLDDSEIKSGDGQVVGKLRGHCMTAGLGLLRVEKVLASQILIVADKYHCNTYKPKWWPV